jgi:hypothetical protein
VRRLELKNEIEHYLGIVKNIWLSSEDQFPDFLVKISDDTKLQHEVYLSSVTEKMNYQMNHLPRLPFRKKRWRERTNQLIQDFLSQENVIGIHHSMEADEMDAFYDELNEFLRNARLFSPDLPLEDVGQAIRNYIVYAMFKLIHQVDTGFSSAGFGYSMLYPYTDNYIDNTALSAKDKQEYNQFIRDTLRGKEVSPASEHHQKTYELIQAIEAEYPRDRDSSIYMLLLYMLEAQEESLRQQAKDAPLTADERLTISLFKGGISVLIDRFLVKKALSEADYIFYLGFGFFLQLADDLQDIGDDSRNGYQTLFTVNLAPEEEERLVNKLFHFLRHIMEDYSAENERFKDFVLNSSYQLLHSSLIRSKEYFSEHYQKNMECYLPVTAAYLEAAKDAILKPQDKKTLYKHKKFLVLLIE